jgi:pimeloyl-ACP methyl ester carboxylesterase
MTKVKANGIDIEYETFGSQDHPPLLLVMGLGAQLIQWPDDFCAQLAGHGFFVIRYDNRDVGLSTHFDEAGEPDVVAAMGGNASPAYTLEDMAADGAGLLDALGIGAAHIVGASMGGMIAQTIDIRHPEKVLTLCSIMSNTGGETSVPPTPEAMAALMGPRPNNREEVIEMAVKATAIIGSTGFDRDEDMTREMAGRSFDRAYHPEGMMRQLVAIMAAPSRVDALKSVSVPTVVIHGTSDTLVPPQNGRLTAEAIPGATLVEVEGMGHDMPVGAWPQVLGAIVSNAGVSA